VTAPPPVEPICVKVNDAARMIGVGRTKLYELIASGEIEVVKHRPLLHPSNRLAKPGPHGHTAPEWCRSTSSISGSLSQNRLNQRIG